MIKYPERRKYNFSIYTPKWDVVIKFDQATAQESYDYFALFDDLNSTDLLTQYEATKKIENYYIDFLKKSTNLKWYQFKKKSKIRFVIKHIEEIQWLMSSKLHLPRESIYNWTETPKVNGEKPRPVLFDSILETIYSKTGIPVDKINDILTLEQIGWYIDKSIFSAYETFDEWKKINDSLKVVKQSRGLSQQDLEDLAFIKAQKNGSWN